MVEGWGEAWVWWRKDRTDDAGILLSEVLRDTQEGALGSDGEDEVSLLRPP